MLHGDGKTIWTRHADTLNILKHMTTRVCVRVCVCVTQHGSHAIH